MLCGAVPSAASYLLRVVVHAKTKRIQRKSIYKVTAFIDIIIRLKFIETTFGYTSKLFQTKCKLLFVYVLNLFIPIYIFINLFKLGILALKK